MQNVMQRRGVVFVQKSYWNYDILKGMLHVQVIILTVKTERSVVTLGR